MNILASIVPIVLYLVVLKAMDAFSFARWNKLTGCFLWGIASVLITLAISCIWRYSHYGTPWHDIWISPVIEETVKVLPLLFLTYRRKVVFLAETLIYGQMIGGGFATAENILYLTSSHHMLIGTALMRGFSTSMLHMGCTSLIASLALFPMQHLSSKEKTTGNTKYIIGVVLALAPSVAIHSFYNMQLLPPLIQLATTVVCFLVLFLCLSAVNDRFVAKWLDLSLNNDIQLIAALKDGHFIDTPTCKYLLSIRDRFEPLVFFDLCTYLILYLQLLVAAKSHVMLHEAGLDSPLSEEERKKIREQCIELDTLSRNIPRWGLLLIRPILHSSTQDRWAIQRLCK